MKILTPKLNSFGAPIPLILRADLVPPKDPPTKPPEPKKALADPPKPAAAPAVATDTAKAAEPAKAAVPDTPKTADPAKAAVAPSPTPTATTTDGQSRDTTGFAAAPESGADEKFSGSTLLVEAYAAIWLVMMAWLLLLWQKQASLTSRLAGLEAAIDRAEKKSAKPVAAPRPKETAKETAPAEEKAS